MNLIVPVFRWTKKAIKLSQVHPAQLDIHVRPSSGGAAALGFIDGFFSSLFKSLFN
jgi:hypothetical protein